MGPWFSITFLFLRRVCLFNNKELKNARSHKGIEPDPRPMMHLYPTEVRAGPSRAEGSIQGSKTISGRWRCMRTKLQSLVKCPEQIQKAEWAVSQPGSSHALPIMDLQKVHRRAGEDTEGHREKAMKQRPRLELRSCKLRNTRDCQQPLRSWKQTRKHPPADFRRSLALLTLYFPTSSLQICETIHSCCFKHLACGALWQHLKKLIQEVNLGKGFRGIEYL